MSQPTDDQWWHEVELGRWTANVIRLVPEGKVEFKGIPRRGYGLWVDGKQIGAMRAKAGGWMCRIDGFEWRVTPDMGTHRFGFKFTPVNLIMGVDAAEKALKAVLASKPQYVPPQLEDEEIPPPSP
jgi:hypothetical protein